MADTSAWQRLKKQWIDDVLDDIALCEFDCRKSPCTYGEWASCERRRSKAAGELMPSAAELHRGDVEKHAATQTGLVSMPWMQAPCRKRDISVDLDALRARLRAMTDDEQFGNHSGTGRFRGKPLLEA